MVEENRNSRAKTMLLYVGIFSIVMLFAAFTSAYIVSMGNGFWVNIRMPKAFYYSTITILVSSATIWWAVKSIKTNNESAFKIGLVLTFILGLTFAYFQFQGWQELIKIGNYASGDIGNLKGEYGVDYTISYQGTTEIFDNGNYYFPEDTMKERPLNQDINKEYNASSGYFYILTFLHLLHLFAGLIYLTFVVIQAFKGKYNEDNYLQPKLVGVYWHFLDILWIYLFFFLFLFH